MGAAIATIGSKLIERENAMIHAAQEASRKQMMHLFHSFASNSSSSATTKLQAKTDIQNTDVVAPLWLQTIGNLVKKSFPAILALVTGGTIMGRIEGWSITDSIYYSFITAGTLGYGDFSPASRRGRIWGIFFIPLAVAAAGDMLGNVASALMERRQKEFYESLLQRELDISRLLEMDTDHDGQVSREEYVHFMLREMELVSEDQLEDLYAQFRRLDTDGGGFLDKNDLQVKLYQRDIEKHLRHEDEDEQTGDK